MVWLQNTGEALDCAGSDDHSLCVLLPWLLQVYLRGLFATGNICYKLKFFCVLESTVREPVWKPEQSSLRLRIAPLTLLFPPFLTVGWGSKQLSLPLIWTKKRKDCQHAQLHGPPLPFLSLRLWSAVLTDELVSEIYVSLGLFGVPLQEDDGACSFSHPEGPSALRNHLQGPSFWFFLGMSWTAAESRLCDVPGLFHFISLATVWPTGLLSTEITEKRWGITDTLNTFSVLQGRTEVQVSENLLERRPEVMMQSGAPRDKTCSLRSILTKATLQKNSYKLSIFAFFKWIYIKLIRK